MLKVSPVRAFSDYIWLIRTLVDPAGAAVVEPGDARPVEDVLDREGLRLRAIFVTYHHRITSEESASLPPDPGGRHSLRRARPGSRQAVNCVHATSLRCRLRSASNDVSTRSCDAGNPRSEPGRRRRRVGV